MTNHDQFVASAFRKNPSTCIFSPTGKEKLKFRKREALIMSSLI